MQKRKKLMVFNMSGKVFKKDEFYINGNKVDNVKVHKYLGVIFDNNGNFSEATRYLSNKA